MLIAILELMDTSREAPSSEFSSIWDRLIPLFSLYIFLSFLDSSVSFVIYSGFELLIYVTGLALFLDFLVAFLGLKLRPRRV